jgi:hypothetical protein
MDGLLSCSRISASDSHVYELANSNYLSDATDITSKYSFRLNPSGNLESLLASTSSFQLILGFRLDVCLKALIISSSPRPPVVHSVISSSHVFRYIRISSDTSSCFSFSHKLDFSLFKENTVMLRNTLIVRKVDLEILASLHAFGFPEYRIVFF